MKTNFEANKDKKKKIYLKYYPGLYPPGAFIAWPNNSSTSQHKEEMPYKRTKSGGFIALPISKQ